MYLDEKALRAGAEGTLFYTTDMLLSRDMLKSDERVIDALQLAWKRCVPLGADRLVYGDYVALGRVLYLALKLQVSSFFHSHCSSYSGWMACNATRAGAPHASHLLHAEETIVVLCVVRKGKQTSIQMTAWRASRRTGRMIPKESG